MLRSLWSMASEMSIVRSIMDSGIYHVPSSFFLRFAQKTRIGDKRDRVTRCETNFPVFSVLERPASALQRELWCVVMYNS